MKKLESNLLLVTGPYKYNGVPLKRVNAAYVLPTNTKLKLGAEVAKNIILMILIIIKGKVIVITIIILVITIFIKMLN